MADTPPETSWTSRVEKALTRLRAGDLGGLYHDIAEFSAWRRVRAQRRPVPAISAFDEPEYWDGFDKELTRSVSWASAADFGTWGLHKTVGRPVDTIELVLELMGGQSDQPCRGLVLGCGDMKGEHRMFVDPRLPFTQVDAYDVSPGSIELAGELTEKQGLPVNYCVADVNEIDLPADHYALIVVLMAYHHFERVDHVAQQINRALTPNGVFFTVDYVGPRRLQYSERQLYYAQHFLSLLPASQRRGLDGNVRDVVCPPSPEVLSPNEAICSDLILPALTQRLDVRVQYNYGGLLYPLLEGLGLNYTRSEADQALMRFLFDVDSALCSSGEVEPSFTVTFARKRT